jgi:hypothetical protein
MGTINRTLEKEDDLTIFTVIGETTAEALIEQLEPFMAGEPTSLVLWNLTEGTMANISADGFRQVVAKVKPNAFRRKGGKTALVFSKDVDYGLGRMVEVFTGVAEMGFETKSFRDVASARQWLGII